MLLANRYFAKLMERFIFTKTYFLHTVHTINLFKREDRLLSISKQAKEQHFALYVWEGVIEQRPFIGIGKAHRQIIKYAKEQGLKYVTVCEDDCAFTSLNAFDYYMAKKPEDFDLWLGMIYAGEIKDGRIMNGFSGLTLYTVHERFYDEFLATDPNDHLDRFLGNSAFKNKYYVCEPFVCHQTGGMSDNFRKEMNYKVYHDKMNFYVGM